MASSTAVILGAGFSYTAGLPLAKDLFNSEFLVPSQRAARRFDAVLGEWQTWKLAHPEQGPEQFLTELYHSVLASVPWDWAAELVAAILATPLPHDRGAYNLRYAGRITRPVNAPIHKAFWDIVLDRFDVGSIVTTNYDLLAERGLRHRPMQRPRRPGIYYGGLRRPQILKGTALPFTVAKPERSIELTGSLPLFKLHGSLNWGTEAGALAIYQDLRPAFRGGGNSQIVPPVLEKEAPEWLTGIWEQARKALSISHTWLVCGYSLPRYDQAINQLFADAARGGEVTRIVLIDPYAAEISHHWQSVAPDAELSLLPKLPDALEPLWQLGASQTV